MARGIDTVEPVKDAIHVYRFDSWSGVRDANDRLVAAFLATNIDCATRRRMSDRIGDEIAQRSLKKKQISIYTRVSRNADTQICVLRQRLIEARYPACLQCSIEPSDLQHCISLFGTRDEKHIFDHSREALILVDARFNYVLIILRGTLVGQGNSVPPPVSW